MSAINDTASADVVTMVDLLADVLAPQYALPSGYDSWGIKSVRPDFTTRNNFRWPWPGNETPIFVLDDHDNPCPRRDGDGICVAKTWAGMSGGGISARTLLLVAYRAAEARGDGDKLRVRQAFVVDLIDGERFVCQQGSRANLPGAYLSGANLTGAYLFRANLFRANLFRANLFRANLFRANLSGANLSGANLSGADLSGADLTGADLTGANLPGAYLSGANLTGAYLFRANLPGAYLYGADLTGAHLTGANLYGADLTGANLAGANLSGADLTGAIGLRTKGPRS